MGGKQGHEKKAEDDIKGGEANPVGRIFGGMQRDSERFPKARRFERSRSPLQRPRRWWPTVAGDNKEQQRICQRSAASGRKEGLRSLEVKLRRTPTRAFATIQCLSITQADVPLVNETSATASATHGQPNERTARLQAGLPAEPERSHLDELEPHQPVALMKALEELRVGFNNLCGINMLSDDMASRGSVEYLVPWNSAIPCAVWDLSGL
eukprot:659437-Karenia_brevis.AAC.1